MIDKDRGRKVIKRNEQKEKEILIKEKESLAKGEKDLHEEKKVTRGELDATSESLNTVYLVSCSMSILSCTGRQIIRLVTVIVLKYLFLQFL